MNNKLREKLMHTINIEGVRLYAYHGCLEEEARIGGEYIVDVQIGTDFSEAASADDLTKTIDYCAVYEICKTEMAIRSKLIEQVCQRIYSSLRKSFPDISSLMVRVTKLHPPISGNVERVSTEIRD
jgi:7,8-dihydroneopterin aldolase/epimerase/oxygenase